MGDLRFEAWALPWAASFVRIIKDLPVPVGGGSGVRRFNDTAGEASISLPADYSRLDEVISSTVGTLIRVYDGTTIIQEFLAERVERNLAESSLVTVSGADLSQMFDRAIVYPFSYPTEPADNHIWGGRDILTGGDMETADASQEIYDVYTDGAGGDTFTLTVMGQTTAAVAWDASTNTLAAAIEALSTVTDVIVDGSGTAADPWRIEFVIPHIVDPDMTGTGTGCTVTITKIQPGNDELIANWTKSQRADQRTDPRIFGEYSVFRRSSGSEPAHGGSHSLVVFGTLWAGAQQVVKVKPGGLYQASAWVYTLGASQTFRLVIRDRYENFIDKVEVTPSADTWTQMSIVDVQIPTDVSEVIVRMATITANPAGIWYFDDATFKEGQPAETVGEIVTALMDDAATDHSGDTRGTLLTWVDYTGFTASLDSSAAAWARDESFIAFRGMRYGQVFDRLVDLDYEWELVPKAAPAGGKTHDLEWYNAGNLGTDHTSSATPAINTGQSVKGARAVLRIPDYTAVLIEGADGAFVEDVDATAETNFGRTEHYYGSKSLALDASLTAVGDHLLDEESNNRTAVVVEIVASDNHPRPLVAYKPGDTIYMQLPSVLAKTARRVRSIAWQNTAPTSYTVTGSRVFPGETGIAEAVRRLLRKFVPLTDEETGAGAGGSAVATEVVAPRGIGAYVHLSRNATQSIASAGAAISWDTLGLQGFAGFAPTVPTTTVTIPRDGYYNIGVQLGWSSFTGGGTITVIKNAVTVWPPADDPGLWSATDGKLFEGTAHAIDCKAGDLISVNVNPDDASAQTLASATIAAYLVDKAPYDGPYRELVMSHGPIAYWRLGESAGVTAADETGTHDATYTNAPTLGEPGIMQDGFGDTATDFVAASSEYVAGSDWATMDFVSGPFSIEAWFSGDALSASYEIIIEKKQSGGSILGWELVVQSSGVSFVDDGAPAGYVVKSGALVSGDSYHVVVTSDQTTTRLYLNGGEVDVDTGGLTITANTELVSIARDTSAAGFNFDGTIDEVAIYDRVLSAQEIADHYAVGTRG
jgi:hypothetical protein